MGQVRFDVDEVMDPHACFDATLVVEPDGDAYLEWIFGGPDGRYNPSRVVLPVAELTRFVAALEIAWSRYLALEAKFPDRSVSNEITVDGFQFKLETSWGVTLFADRPTVRPLYLSIDHDSDEGSLDDDDPADYVPSEEAKMARLEGFKRMVGNVMVVLPRLRELAAD